jgi:hypothetical protein
MALHSGIESIQHSVKKSVCWDVGCSFGWWETLLLFLAVVRGYEAVLWGLEWADFLRWCA